MKAKKFFIPAVAVLFLATACGPTEETSSSIPSTSSESSSIVVSGPTVSDANAALARLLYNEGNPGSRSRVIELFTSQTINGYKFDINYTATEATPYEGSGVTILNMAAPLLLTHEGTTLFLGTNGPHDTIGLYNESNLSNADYYVIGLYEAAPAALNAEKTNVDLGAKGENGKTYKVGLYSYNLGKYVFLNGETGNYLPTTESFDEALEFVYEASGEGFTLKASNGKYLGATFGEYNNAAYVDEPFVWTRGEGHAFADVVSGYTVENAENPYAVWKLTATANYEGTAMASKDFTIRIDPTAPVDDGVVPEDGKTYRLGTYHQGKGSYLFFTGKMDGFYFGTTGEWLPTAVLQATVTDAETNALSLQITNGENAGQYIATVWATGSDGNYHQNVVLQSEPFTWTFDEEHMALTGMCGDEEVFLCMGSKYDTIEVEGVDSLGSSDYYAVHLYDSETGKPSADIEDGEALPDGHYEGQAGVEPEVGKDYTLGVYHANKGYYVYVDGTIVDSNGNRFQSTKAYADAATVTVEEGTTAGTIALKVEDGYLAAGAYTDGQGGEKVAAAITETKFDWTYDEEYKTVVGTVNGKTYYFGVYGTYDTISVSSASYLGADGNHPVQFYTAEPTAVFVPNTDDLPDVELPAEATNIAGAYEKTLGESVAVVAYISGRFSEDDRYLFLADGDLGLSVYNKNLGLTSSFTAGKVVLVEGKLAEYQGYWQISNATATLINDSDDDIVKGLETPATLVYDGSTPIELTDYGRPIEATGTVASAELDGSYFDIDLTVGAGSIPVHYESGKSGEAGFAEIQKIAVGDNVTFKGILSAYNGAQIVDPTWKINE